MERRKGIPLIALIIFVALLVAIIVTCVIILRSNKNKKTNSSILENVTPANTVQPDEHEEDNGEEITSEKDLNSNTTVKEAYKSTGNKKTFAKYAIYLTGGFNADENNITDEMKLQLAMAQVTAQDMDSSTASKAVSGAVIEKYIGKIFESNTAEFKDFSLYNSDTNFTSKYKTIGYTYDSSSKLYEVKENDIEEEYPPEITEVVTKAIIYNNKVEIFVKPLYVLPFYSEEVSGMACALYKNYDFSYKDFSDDYLLQAFTYKDYENTLKSSYNGDIDEFNYSEISKYVDLNSIDEYKYTFNLLDGEYKLHSFEKVETLADKTREENEGPKDLTTNDKNQINAQIEEYVGDIPGDEVIELLQKVIAIHENNLDKKDVYINISLGDKNAEYNDNLEDLNKEISDLVNEVDTDKTYTIKPTYKQGLIRSVSIKEK